MRLLLVTAVTFLFVTLVYCSVENKSEDEKSVKIEESSTKTKRGIHGYGSGGFSYPLPVFGRYSPYARYPGSVTNYALTPGNAVVHSFNVNYPKVIVSKIRPAISPQILIQSKPVLPVYANRYPVFFQKSIIQKPIASIVPVSQFSTPAFISSSSPHIHTVNTSPSSSPHIHTVNTIPSSSPHIHNVNPIAIPNNLPQPTLISQDGWRPVFSSVQNVQSNPINPPAVTVLPPLNPSHLSTGPSLTQMSKNYYLPPDPSEQYQHQQQHDLQAHLQQLQAIQHHQNFFRSEQNEGLITPLSEQGYETASNNGIYAGPSSYDPNPSGPLYEIHSRGQFK
ncbi:uncharacterized protein LOC116341271 [Contarinia nasturtii]|uniref:uncharacterized protein LOC116341271 n=1 Tax=Contarinia nasturtii TaxID=265458 RepID=UPI0012D46825|nr:uncharacterized protein LOC116341271 [Contarinia nasturtii]